MSAGTVGLKGRLFRLSPPDRTGLMFGLGLAQLLVLGAGVVLGSMLMVSTSVPSGITILVLGATLGLVRIQGTPVLVVAPHAVRFLRQRTSTTQGWYTRVPLVGGNPEAAPGALGDHDVVVIDAGEVGVGPPGQLIAVSRDRRAATYAATLRVAGRQFALTERSEQDWLLSQWGTALQAFIGERTPVQSIRWSEWAAPAGLEEHRSWLREHLDANPLADVREAYEQLLAQSGSTSTRHEVLVTVTVQAARVRLGQRHNRDPGTRRDRGTDGRDQALRPAPRRGRPRGFGPAVAHRLGPRHALTARPVVSRPPRRPSPEPRRDRRRSDDRQLRPRRHREHMDLMAHRRRMAPRPSMSPSGRAWTSLPRG